MATICGKTLGLRARVLVWLSLTLLPILVIGLVSIVTVQDRLTTRAEVTLENFLGLEEARIERELDSIAEYVAYVAMEEPLIAQMSSGENANFRLIAEAIAARTRHSEARVRDILILDNNLRALGGSVTQSWNPDRELLRSKVLGDGTRHFGSAFRLEAGDDRLPIAVPIEDHDGNRFGVLAAEVDLGQIVDLVSNHEKFGETSEAHIAQADADGNAAFITPLRFEQDAAFTKVVPQSKGLPINQSLTSPAVAVLHADDYRSEPSILAIKTIDDTGWGLVVKIDEDEALGLTRSIRNLSIIGLAGTVAAILIGWGLVLHPLARRVRRVAGAAERIASGVNDQPIQDSTNDEIGDMARSIDRLAHDLKVDVALRSEAERKLRHQANHDALTGIANRTFADETLRDLTADSPRTYSVLFVDLDEFKLVNDTWGHNVGDEVLVEAARRLQSTVTETETALVARWGGDEFLLILPGYTAAEVNKVTRRVRQVFRDPIRTSVGEHRLSCSVGPATSDGSQSLSDLLHAADAQLFAEKQARARQRLISPETARLVETALADDRIEAWYQPLFAIDANLDTRIVGAEALVRLRTPEGEIIAPGMFLPELGDSRFARAIDMRVAELAFADLANWQQRGLVDADFHVTINLSAASVNESELCTELSSIAGRQRVKPSSVVLELSEDVVDLSMPITTSLREAGFVLAVDDLGLKHSNLDRLLTSGAKIAKIDRRWLHDRVVLEGLIGTCKGKGMTVVVEGIETREQLEMVADLGADQGQGFLIGRPQPAHMFRSLDDLRHDPEPIAVPALSVPDRTSKTVS